MVEPPAGADAIAPRRVMDQRLRFSVFGPLEARDDNGPLDVGPYQQRVLLAGLLCRANTVLPVEQLLDMIWGGRRPRTARKNLQVYVSALRKITGGRIGHHAYGYMLRAEVEEVDLLRFDGLVAAGRDSRRAGDLEAASRLLGDAVRLWRDYPLVDLLGNPFIAAEADRLAEQYLAVYEDWVDLEIDGGRYLDVLSQLGDLVRRHPLRERLTIAAMTAAHLSGGRKEALACYEAHRRVLARELGLDPSPVLQQLYRDILAGTPVGDRLPAAVSGQRRLKPAQLPRDLPDFVGRAEQVDALVAALTGGGTDVAVISGPTGAGKTALAVHVGHLLADRFVDGNLFVCLRDESGTPRAWRDVLAELMRGTGLEITPPAEHAAALALWRSWLADRRFLFVLDDATSQACVRWLLPGCGASRTLVTSTRRLSGLESACRVQAGELSPAEAADLLGRVLGSARLAGAGDAIGQIFARCGGLPLVIRTVAVKLSVLRHLSLAGYADQLERAGEPLDELVIGDVSVRSRLCRFHDSLPPLLRVAFGILGALPNPPFPHGEIVAALDRLSEPAERVLEALLETSLLEVAEDWVATRPVSYVMPVLAYRFALTLGLTRDRPAPVADVLGASADLGTVQ